MSKYNVLKLASPYERIKDFEDSPEKRLFKSVITQAIVDASNVSNAPNHKKEEKISKAWLFTDNETFVEYCYMIDLEPDYVRRIADQMIKMHVTKKLTNTGLDAYRGRISALLKLGEQKQFSHKQQLRQQRTDQLKNLLKDLVLIDARVSHKKYK